MFTIEQIKTAHSNVKSGADFPKYIQEIKAIGVKYYEHFVADGHIEFYGADQFNVSGDVKWKPIEVAKNASVEKLQHALKIHQKGQTDYQTFCKQSAEAGVEKWVVDLVKMLCTYFDKENKKILAEAIPTA